MRRDTLGMLEDIRDAAGFIVEDTTDATLESFLADRRMRQLVERNFTVIGEVINRLSRHDPVVVARISAHAEIVAFRNALVHGYDVIDYERVWQIIQVSLPVLRAEVDDLLSEAGDETST